VLAYISLLRQNNEDFSLKIFGSQKLENPINKLVMTWV